MELISDLDVMLVSGGLRDIDPPYDVVDISYAEPQPGLPGLACICY